MITIYLMLPILGLCISLIALGVGLVNIIFDPAQVPWYSWVLIISGLCGLLILGIGRFWAYYDIIYSGNWKLRVNFILPKCRKILLLGTSPRLGFIKAQIAYEYKYDGQTTRTIFCDANWEGEVGIWTLLNGEGERILHMWQWVEQGQATLDNSKALLPNEFVLIVQLIKQAGNKKIDKEHRIPIKIDYGSFAKEGFSPSEK